MQESYKTRIDRESYLILKEAYGYDVRFHSTHFKEKFLCILHLDGIVFSCPKGFTYLLHESKLMRKIGEIKALIEQLKTATSKKNRLKLMKRIQGLAGKHVYASSKSLYQIEHGN
jgi:hypothetical protein